MALTERHLSPLKYDSVILAKHTEWQWVEQRLPCSHAHISDTDTHPPLFANENRRLLEAWRSWWASALPWWVASPVGMVLPGPLSRVWQQNQITASLPNPSASCCLGCTGWTQSWLKSLLKWDFNIQGSNGQRDKLVLCHVSAQLYGRWLQLDQCELLDFTLQAMTVSLMACCYSVPKKHPGLRQLHEKESLFDHHIKRWAFSLLFSSICY